MACSVLTALDTSQITLLSNLDLHPDLSPELRIHTGYTIAHLTLPFGYLEKPSMCPKWNAPPPPQPSLLHRWQLFRTAGQNLAVTLSPTLSHNPLPHLLANPTGVSYKLRPDSDPPTSTATTLVRTTPPLPLNAVLTSPLVLGLLSLPCTPRTRARAILRAHHPSAQNPLMVPLSLKQKPKALQGSAKPSRAWFPSSDFVSLWSPPHSLCSLNKPGKLPLQGLHWQSPCLKYSFSGEPL